LICIIGVYVTCGADTFDYVILLKRPLGDGELWLSLGFLVAFLVKLPALPFHFWMPSIFSNSPVSALMTGILIKTGAYGLMRFYVPMFPNATHTLAPYMMILGIAGLIYGALVAYSQKDIKKILAYSTISHVGLILAGIFSERSVSMTGVTVLLITQALGTGALLMICNHVTEFTKSRELGRFSGLYHSMPKAGVLALFFAMASIGLPGLGNFVGEWFVLRGLFHRDWIIGSIAAAGIVLSALYMLRFIHGIFFGQQSGVHAPSDLPFKSVLLFAGLVVIIAGIGIYPSPLVDLVAPLWSH
jgi:NADH-quinone oxidoreductase subunit M